MNGTLYKKAMCEDCESTQGLHIHAYRDWVKCEDCINKELKAASELEEFQANFEELQQEREA